MKKTKHYTRLQSTHLFFWKLLKYMCFQMIFQISVGGIKRKKPTKQTMKKQFPREAENKNWSAWEGSTNITLENKCSLLTPCFQGQKWNPGGLWSRIFKWPNQNLVQINSLLQTHVISSFSTKYTPIEGYFAKYVKYSKIWIVKQKQTNKMYPEMF